MSANVILAIEVNRGLLMSVVWGFSGAVYGEGERGRKWQKNDDSKDRCEECKGIWEDKGKGVTTKRSI